jgi:hypothetical protein
MLRGFANPLLEYSASSKTCGDSNFHGEVVNLFYTSDGGGTVRYNHFRDSYNGASGYPAGGGTGVVAIAETSAAEIYGNIFERYYAGNGAVAAPWNNDNIKVYNNTIVNSGTNSPTVNFPDSSLGLTGIGNVAYNNLCVGCVEVVYSGVGTFGYNGTDATSVFVNYAAGDFRLASHTSTAGTPLPAPYNLDFAGNTRGADGVWDVGAYQLQP